MATTKSYVAIEALVMVPRTSGSTEAVYGGRPVPADITDEALERLLAEGFIAEVGVPEDEVGGIQNDDPDGRPASKRVRRTKAQIAADKKAEDDAKAADDADTGAHAAKADA